ncbi:hypothetical protein ABEF95_008226 [Exophiala dermatitidis]
MGRRQVTADELLARAEANGYKRGEHKEKDEIRDSPLHRYVLWNLGQMQRDYIQRGLPPPDEATARERCLGEGVDAPDLATVKDFLRFYVATSRGKIVKQPTADSLNTFAEWFFAGFTRVTGTPTDADEKSEVYNWVRKTLTAEGLVDDLIYIHERYRLQFTFIFLVYCWTGARIGAFFKGALLYKDIDIVLQRTDTGRWRLIYEIKQRWVKNNRDPENICFGAAGKEHERFIYNDAAYLLAMAIADGALFGFKSLDDLQKQEIPPGENELILRYNESALDGPILRKCTKADGVTDEPMPKSAFLAIYEKTLKNAGYFCRTSIHSIRRQLGKKVDEKYTAVQRSQHLTQADPRVFGQSYVANCSSVDGQAAFLGESSDHRHIDYFQSLEKFREQGLPCKLPAHLEETISRDPHLCELQSEVQALTLKEGQGATLTEAKRRLASYRKTLKHAALRQHQEEWVRERRDWKILTRGKEQPGDICKTDLAGRLCLIPERGRLAQRMASDEPLSPDAMWDAMRDLHALCIRDFSVLYLPGLEPVDGACPVKCCQLQLDR